MKLLQAGMSGTQSTACKRAGTARAAGARQACRCQNSAPLSLPRSPRSRRLAPVGCTRSSSMAIESLRRWRGKAKLYTRSGLDWTERFKSLSETIAQIPARSALIDGEAVVLDENGSSDFGRLQNALKSSQDEVRFYAFDLLERDGEDMAPLPLEERKARLSALLAEAPESVVYSDH